MALEERGLPPLVAVTVRRGLVAGKLYLALGTGIALLLAIVLLRAKAGVFATTFPLELPLFGVLGSMGGMMIFASDRSKGVMEYLIAYGVRPTALFLNILLTTIVLAAVVEAAGLAVGVGAYVALGNPVTQDLEQSLGLYTIPMTFAGALFSTTCGMIWSALSTPRMSMNSPVGVAPLLGVAPPILVLVVAEAFPKSDYYYITAGAAAGFLVVVIALLAIATRVMGRERYLSPL